MKQYVSKEEFLNAIKLKYGFRSNGEIAYTEISGYGFSLNKVSKYYYTLSTSVNFNHKEKKKSLIDGLTLLKNNARVENTIENNHRITILIKTKFSDERFLSELSTIIESLIVLFNELELVPTCWNCNKEGRYTTYRKGLDAFELCDDCVEKLNHYHNQLQDKKKENPSYLFGFLGAFLGASIGGVLWLIISLMGFYTSLVGVAMGYLSYNGYLFFKGNRGKYMAWLILLSVVLVIILTSVLETSYYLYTDPEYSLTRLQSLTLGFRSLYDSYYFYVDKVWKNIIMALIFAIMGCFRYVVVAAQESKLHNNEPLAKFFLESN